MRQMIRLDNKNGFLQEDVGNLHGDLQTLHEQLEVGQPVSLNILKAIEKHAVRLLAVISPEIRRADAEFEKYQATPKIGDAQ